MSIKVPEREWHETVLDLITNPEGVAFARFVLENQSTEELRKLVRHFRRMNRTEGLTGLAIAGLGKAACINWLLQTPGVEFQVKVLVCRKDLD